MKIRKSLNHGEVRYRLDWRDADGVRHRPNFKTLKEAEDEMKRLKQAHRRTGETWETLPAVEREALVRLYEEAKLRGLDVRAAIQQAKAPAPPRVRASLSEAILGTIQAKREQNRRERYIVGLEGYLRSFAKGRESQFIDEVTTGDIEDWIRARPSAASTRASNLGRISSLFTEAVHRGWISVNPCDRIRRPSVEAQPIVILTHRETCKVLGWARRRGQDLLAWVVLALLAGIRPEEAEKIQWDDVDLDERIVRVPASAGKVRQRRIVHLSWQAWVWLTLAKDLGSRLPLPHATRRRRLREMRLWFGWAAWPQDVLRKTYASNTLALWQDAERLADEMGTSTRMIFVNYREIVRRTDASRWAEIIPRLWCRWPRQKIL
jgi:integrase